jgi:hypothetical protein
MINAKYMHLGGGEIFGELIGLHLLGSEPVSFWMATLVLKPVVGLVIRNYNANG